MPEEMEVGCARPTGGPVRESDVEPVQQQSQPAKEQRAMIQVGKKAPDFVAPAYRKGRFVSVKLPECQGK